MKTTFETTIASASYKIADKAKLDFYESRDLAISTFWGEGRYIKGTESDEQLFEIAETWVNEEEEYQSYRLDFDGVIAGLKDYVAEVEEYRNRDLDQYPF